MTAYSFQKQFVEPILAGTKRQTIRAVGKRRHAESGKELQLYTGMRTKHCRLIARATCVDVWRIVIGVSYEPIRIAAAPWGEFIRLDERKFAKADGFASWQEMRDFWQKHHPGVDHFEGLMIMWGEIRT